MDALLLALVGVLATSVLGTLYALATGKLITAERYREERRRGDTLEEALRQMQREAEARARLDEKQAIVSETAAAVLKAIQVHTVAGGSG